MQVKVIFGEKNITENVPEDYTIKELLKKLEVPTETVVVKRNQEIVIEEESICQGDTIEIIKVIFGG